MIFTTAKIQIIINLANFFTFIKKHQKSPKIIAILYTFVLSFECKDEHQKNQ